MTQSQFQTAMMLGAAADRLMVHEFPNLTPNPDTFARTFERKYGWDLIGKGAYGAVFDHPKQFDLVFKVGTNLEDGWLSYAAFCMRNWTPSSPLLEVHEIAIFEHCYVAIFERLENWRGSQFNLDAIEREREVVEGRRGYHNGKYDDLVKKMHDELGVPWDLHQGNVMVRCGTQLVWTDPYSGMYGPESYKHYTREHRVERYRTTLAPASPSPVLRDEAKDQMLRFIPKHDNRAFGAGIPSALLPGRRSRRLRTAQCGADVAGVAAAPARQASPVGRDHKLGQREIAERLLRDRRALEAHVAMAREVRHKRDGGQEVRDRLQPAPEPDNRADLRARRAESVARQEARDRRAEVRDARLKHDMVFGDFAAIERRLAAHHIMQLQHFQFPAIVIDRDGGRVVSHKVRAAREVIGDPRNLYEWARDIFAQPVPRRSDRRVA